MSAEAILLNAPPCEHSKTAVAAIASGEVQQMHNGRAAVYVGLNAAASGDRVGWTEEGRFTLTKATGLVMQKGQEVWWDHSADNVILYPASDKDFCLGSLEEDATSAATTCVVNLNVRPSYKIDSGRGGVSDEFLGAIVKTVVGSTTVEVPHIEYRPGSWAFIFGATAEAQKIALISQQGFALASNWIAEGGFDVIDDGDAAAIDFNIGVANADHASDADAITESCFFHLDGNDLNLFAESDDGTTEVAATDTTTNIVLGTPVHWVLDGRDPSNVKFYVNGVEQLAATANLGNIAAAAGPLKLLAHLEKTADDTTADYRILYLRVRTMEQD